MSDWDDDERPSFGFSRKREAEDASDDGDSGTGFKGFNASNMSNKRFKPSESNGFHPQTQGQAPSKPSGKAGGFAARMMAKMGYKEGQGLGSDGRGRLAPIDIQLRPQGVGVGAVKEKTKQAKAEERRAAQLEGREVAEDSSEEERQRKKKAKEARKSGAVNGNGKVKAPARKKTVYKTWKEIEQDANGLQIPDVFKNMVDLAGAKAEVPSLGLSPGQFVQAVPEETEAERIAKRARRELEFFTAEWATIQEEKKAAEFEVQMAVQKTDSEDVQSREARRLLDVITELEDMDLNTSNGDLDSVWERVTTRLEKLELEFDVGVKTDNRVLNEIAVATISPLFKASLSTWDALSNPTFLADKISRLQHILGADTRSTNDDDALIHEGDLFPTYTHPSKRSSSTPYESLMSSTFLPALRTSITLKWSVHNPEPFVTLLDTWKPLLPTFIHSAIVSELLIPRLKSAIAEYRPSSKSSSAKRLPHAWLFPWLEHLPFSALDPSSSHSVTGHLKSRLRSLLSRHDISTGPPSYMAELAPLLGTYYQKIILERLVPRLSSYLSQNFHIAPQDQDMAAFDVLLSYEDLLTQSTFTSLFTSHLTPQILNVIYLWLAGAPDFEQLSTWLSWWEEQLPLSVRSNDDIQRALNLAEELYLRRRALGDVYTLYPITAPPSISNPQPQTQPQAKAAPPPADVEEEKESSFMDVLHAWTEEQNLLFMPTREAHPSGAALYRITASANGKGGVLCYIEPRQDVLRVRVKKGEDVQWVVMSPGEELLGLVEGK